MKPALIKFEIIDQPEIVIVGKLIHANDIDMQNGKNNITPFWKKCLKDGTFNELKDLAEHVYVPALVGYADINDCNLLQRDFDYICGMMMNPNVPSVPKGFVKRSLTPVKVAKGRFKRSKGEDAVECWKTAYRCMMIEAEEKGVKLIDNCWGMEAYSSTIPDNDGNIVVDYYYPCK